ncbi:glyoxalase/bleomycin resistance/extradiol dioxygenase family protein [candidate division KSB3 bacterium]|uniref:Glyoxalase/bleomycin resistance/extradiol dioxygenase family protein n=1 Tax=candidate division KSB3 bacterium TaxID=2044937 RepID=A0A2G6K8S3_9BACT|nr:MAG: glyoxalase/bleomycin resistance/extradiol dioxygenase family protein [candidate division KSB3 bacterium]
MKAEKGILQGNLGDVQHLGIPVQDVAAAKAWYVNNLGFEIAHETSIPTAEGNVEIAFLSLGALTMEFYQPAGQEAKEIASRQDGHIDHIALHVADVEQAYKDVKAAGLTPLEDAPVFLNTLYERGVKYFNVRGPNGEKVEFNQIL